MRKDELFQNHTLRILSLTCQAPSFHTCWESKTPLKHGLFRDPHSLEFPSSRCCISLNWTSASLLSLPYLWPFLATHEERGGNTCGRTRVFQHMGVKNRSYLETQMTGNTWLLQVLALLYTASKWLGSSIHLFLLGTGGHPGTTAGTTTVAPPGSFVLPF